MTTKPKKTTPVSQEDFEAELQSSIPEKKVITFDSVTIGISNKVGGGFNLVKVPLDSVNLVSGEPEVIDTAENKWEANEKFKIYVIKHGVL